MKIPTYLNCYAITLKTVTTLVYVDKLFSISLETSIVKAREYAISLYGTADQLNINPTRSVGLCPHRLPFHSAKITEQPLKILLRRTVLNSTSPPN